jgi:hypothetical protein
MIDFNRGPRNLNTFNRALTSTGTFANAGNGLIPPMQPSQFKYAMSNIDIQTWELAWQKPSKQPAANRKNKGKRRLEEKKITSRKSKVP